MTTRHAACSCGQLHLTVEGEPLRISMCSCLACQRRTGAVISNQARFRREQVTRKGYDVDADSRERPRADLSFLSDVRLHRLLGEHRLSWNHHDCHRQLRRPEFPSAYHRGVGRVTPPLGLLATRRPSAWRSRDDRHSAGFTRCRCLVRFGSSADICSALAHVCFGPESDIRLLNYFVGAGE